MCINEDNQMAAATARKAVTKDPIPTPHLMSLLTFL